MKKILPLFLSALLCVGFASDLFAQTSEFLPAKGSGSGGVGEFTKWNFEIGGNKYEFSNKGRGKRVSAKNRVTNFRVPLKNEEISSFYFAEYRGDILLLFETTDGEVSAGYVVRLGRATLRPRWRAMINSLNVSAGLIEKRAAYLVASGFAAKLDLETGKYLWKHDDLYRKYSKRGAFNVLEIPEVEGSNVIFTETLEHRGVNLIVINKTSGKVVRTIIN